MPFMVGREPVRRTLKYLESGSLKLKDSIQIVALCFGTVGDHHTGLRDFIFWRLPQLQYKNPNVQVITIRNKSPTSYIWCFYENNKRMLIDCHNKTQDEIMNHLKKVICKTDEVLAAEEKRSAKQDNPANFGYKCEKACMCEVPGQLPCPSVVPVPYHLRKKYEWKIAEIPEPKALWEYLKEK